ncbi:hypothetical protein D1920_05275 [Rhodopseudomonas palustris]|nr:hypothetical protein D1920_05275 [Rhodopseudomonas palustris]
MAQCRRAVSFGCPFKMLAGRFNRSLPPLAAVSSRSSRLNDGIITLEFEAVLSVVIVKIWIALLSASVHLASFWSVGYDP